MTTRELDRTPNLARLYAQALLRGVGRAEGWPDEELVLPAVGVDRARLAAYARTCGFRLRDRLPPTYPHVLAFPLAVELMARPSFPLPLPGLVHVGNRITQHRPLFAGQTLTVRARLEGLRPHARGRQFDALAEVAADGEVAWRSVSTYLRRDGTHAAGAGAGGDEASSGVQPDAAPTAVWDVPADIGRRYAAVSGDRNPIHTSTVAARLFGLPGRIAHGMWSKARCLAALQARLPERFDVEVAFRKPVVLPTRVAFLAAARDGGWGFELRAVRDARVHLVGTLSAPDAEDGA